MLTSSRLRLIAVLAVFTLLLGAGAALASGTEDPTADPTCTTEPTSTDTGGDTGTDPTVDPGEEGDQNEDSGSIDPVEAPDTECADPDETEDPEGTDTETTTDDPSDTGTETPVPPVDREAECNAAAGIVIEPPADPSTEPATTEPVEKTTGLDHAIERVLANCIKNPQAPGLTNALMHLVANRDRHAAHEAEKAAAKLARDAAKADRTAAHDAAKAARDAAKAERAAAHDAAHASSTTHGNSGH